ncbi:hypothetical protein [Pseudomonas corrugata]|uniref:hypothetical protein n=1 Tax=Pseudomonas corrugata TaxID=47879 RepID=UPI001586968E|nr:hypothetical protein [Pseudomonas corrugata]MCI0994861.1 hypothetical protein [Pseudomonas corrugata]NUT66092.1 hypothetical protein [Pseudomonas corrugata]
MSNDVNVFLSEQREEATLITGKSVRISEALATRSPLLSLTGMKLGISLKWQNSRTSKPFLAVYMQLWPTQNRWPLSHEINPPV